MSVTTHICGSALDAFPEHMVYLQTSVHLTTTTQEVMFCLLNEITLSQFRVFL